MSPVSNISHPDAEAALVVDLATFGAELLQRREALGDPELPRNSGKRRTASKHALLEEIVKTGRRW